MLWLLAPCVALAGVILALSSFASDPSPEEKKRSVPQAVVHPLRGVDDWIGDDRFGAQQLQPSEQYGTPLKAHRFSSWTYTQMDAKSQTLGSVRQGRVLWGERKDSYRGCNKGWYALAQGGYACVSGSFRVVDSEDDERLELDPARDSALPYAYVQVTTDGAPRYNRIPTPEEEVAVYTRGGARNKAVDVRMVGDYFLAVLGEEENRGRRFYRTLRDKFVRVEDVTASVPTAMHGKKNPALPLAFVIDDEAPVFNLKDEAIKEAGSATRYERFTVEQVIERDQTRYVVGKDGRVIRAASVRVASAQPRPSEVGEHEKWIHVDLSEQVLVAYEGDKPVLATLVSSGKPGHDTPTGSFRIRHKHVSTTMRGNDPVDGRYEVAEVPWTMYYDGAYALHGAYWHDQFGNVKSHGCTNLAPADARWLLRWTEPALPTGWHSIKPRTPGDGTLVHITQ